MREIYDEGKPVQVTGTLAAYVALLDGKLPAVDADTLTVWASTSERLRKVLRREGEVVRCPELNTQFPKVA